MFAHSFSGRGKCPPLIFQEGANVLPLVLGRGKCPGGKCPGVNVLHSIRGWTDRRLDGVRDVLAYRWTDEVLTDRWTDGTMTSLHLPVRRKYVQTTDRRSDCLTDKRTRKHINALYSPGKTTVLVYSRVLTRVSTYRADRLKMVG